MGSKNRERTSTKRMLHFNSRILHFDYMNELNTRPKPVSILIDTSMDKSNNHFLVIDLYYIKNEKPTFIFYRLIEIGFEEKSRDLFDYIIRAFQDDEMENYFKENLVGFISDSARVLTGSKNSVTTKFK